MRKLLTVLFCCCLLVAAAATDSHSKSHKKKGGHGSSPEDRGGGHKVCLCHIPPGNPDAAHTICVGAPAVSAHLHHGDKEGACRVECGGDTGVVCDDDEFCKRPEGQCDEDAKGVCASQPSVCPVLLSPVCGCDGTTYDNACFAAAAGVTVDHRGPCEEVTVCGGTAGATCDEGQFCKKREGECAEDAEGVCAAKPETCPVLAAPVCGCDGVTYDNACFAHAAGVNVASRGECPVSVACGGETGATCGEGEFCKAPEGKCEENAEGTCTGRPEICTVVFEPVCGCDGNTYHNACMADAAGVSVAAPGACPQPVACGGETGGTCNANQFCKTPPGQCSESPEGVCVVPPELCPVTFEPVCGCDGMTYHNGCFADAAGTNVDHAGDCT